MKSVLESCLLFILFSSIHGEEEIGNEGDELFTEDFPFVKGWFTFGQENT